jgi:hypothetical protein
MASVQVRFIFGLLTGEGFSADQFLHQRSSDLAVFMRISANYGRPHGAVSFLENAPISGIENLVRLSL